MKNMKTFKNKAFTALIILGVGSGTLISEKQKTQPFLKTILKEMANYCDAIQRSSFDFICDEIVEQEEFYKMKLQYGSRPRPVPLTKGAKDSFLYAYRLTQKNGEVEESRTLLRDGDKQTFKENAKLYTRFHHQLIVFGPLVFQHENQHLYHFRIKKRIQANDRDVLIVEVTAKPGSFAPVISGEFWIDENDFTIHKICLSQENIQGFDIIEKVASSLHMTPRLTITQEYSILKRGIRFPSRAVLEESYISSNQSRFLNISRIEIKYENYQFYKITASSAVEKYNELSMPR